MRRAAPRRSAHAAHARQHRARTPSIATRNFSTAWFDFIAAAARAPSRQREKTRAARRSATRAASARTAARRRALPRQRAKQPRWSAAGEPARGRAIWRKALQNADTILKFGG